MATVKQIKSRIEQEIARVNRGRKVRTISYRDVMQSIMEAQGWEQYGFACGGYVANSYRYRASSAAVYAVKIAPKTMAIVFGAVDAHGGSETTWATGCAKNDLEGQRARFGPRTDAAIVNNHFLVSTRQAALLIADTVAARQAAAEKNLEAIIPDVVLTKELSIAAGNCSSQTERVAKLVGRDSMPAREVAAVLMRRGLAGLVPFVRRAAEFAVAHA